MDWFHNVTGSRPESEAVVVFTLKFFLYFFIYFVLVDQEQ